MIDLGYTAPIFVVINYYIFARSFECISYRVDTYHPYDCFACPVRLNPIIFRRFIALTYWRSPSAGSYRMILYFKMILNFPLDESLPSRKLQLILLQQKFAREHLLIAIFLFLITYLNFSIPDYIYINNTKSQDRSKMHLKLNEGGIEIFYLQFYEYYYIY